MSARIIIIAVARGLGVAIAVVVIERRALINGAVTVLVCTVRCLVVDAWVNRRVAIGTIIATNVKIRKYESKKTK